MAIFVSHNGQDMRNANSKYNDQTWSNIGKNGQQWKKANKRNLWSLVSAFVYFLIGPQYNKYDNNHAFLK